LLALRGAGAVFGDPGAALRLVARGREGLHRYALTRMLGLTDASIGAFYDELQANTRFLHYISKMGKVAMRPLGGFPRPQDLYVICRATKPTVIVETGVASGVSSAYFLQALDENQVGKLYSIDLPDADTEELLGQVLTRLPEGRSSGWVVPDWLRGRWDLRIGKSSDVLPRVMKEVGNLGIFLHDSEHSLDNMMFELNLAWPNLSPDGFLLSDDVNLPSTKGAFHAFAEKVGRRPEKLFSGYGAIRK
jgi:hypothetical protein